MTSHGTPAVTTASPLMDGGSDVWQGVSQNNPQLQSEHRSKPNKRCFIFHQGSNCVILRLRIRKHFYTFSSDTLHQSGHEVKGLEAHKNKEYSPSSIFYQTNQYEAKNASSILTICSMIWWNDAMCVVWVVLGILGGGAEWVDLGHGGDIHTWQSEKCKKHSTRWEH